MKQVDIQAWGNEIRDGRCNVEKPTEEWFIRMVKQGAVGATRRPAMTQRKKSTTDALAEMKEQMAIMDLEMQQAKMK